jgi:hypothetical protein
LLTSRGDNPDLLYDISTTPTWHYCVTYLSCVIAHVFYLSYYFNAIYFIFFQDKTIMSRNRHLMYKNPLCWSFTYLVNVMKIWAVLVCCLAWRFVWSLQAWITSTTLNNQINSKVYIFKVEISQ